MLQDIKALIHRSGYLLLQDLIGVSLLVLLFAVGLHLPVFA